MSYFTYKRDTGGVQVLRKGRQIEHYSGTLLSSDRTRPSPHMLIELRTKCRHIEDTLGLESTCGRVIWNWSWFEGCPADSPVLPLIGLTPGLYSHGFTKADAEKAAASSCPVYPEREPNGSCAIIVGDVPIMVYGGDHNTPANVMPFVEGTVVPDEFGGWYHPLASQHYHPAKMDQPYHCGPCYASYKSVAAWCEHHGITEVVAHEIINATNRERNSK